MSRTRPRCFWFLLAFTVALFVWWCTYVPHTPGRIFTAIPGNATFVSVHDDLSARWESVCENPLALSLATSAGVSPGKFQEMAVEPEFQRLIRQFAPHEALWAYLPSTEPLGEPAWVFASWVGGRSVLMRWALTFDLVPEVSKRTLPSGASCWVVRTDDLPDTLTLTVTLVEGMLLGCVARSPLSIQHVLDTHDGHIPAVTLQGALDLSDGPCAPSGAPDRGWLTFPELPWDTTPAPPILRYELTHVDRRELSGRLCAGGALTGSYPVENTPGFQELGQLLGDLPMAFCALHPTAALSLLDATTPPVWSRALGRIIKGYGRGPVVLAVVGGDFSGRYLGIKVPGLVAAVQVDNPAVLASMRQSLDMLNHRYRWGLIPREVQAGRHTLYAAESTVEGKFFKLELKEKPAYGLYGNWLLLSSNLDTLARLLERSAAPAKADSERWLEGLSEKPSPAYAWFDLDQSAKTLRTAIKFYSLKLLMTDAKNSQRVRQNLNVSVAWINALAPMGTCHLWLSSDGAASELTFTLGEGAHNSEVENQGAEKMNRELCAGTSLLTKRVLN